MCNLLKKLLISQNWAKTLTNLGIGANPHIPTMVSLSCRFNSDHLMSPSTSRPLYVTQILLLLKSTSTSLYFLFNHQIKIKEKVLKCIVFNNCCNSSCLVFELYEFTFHECTMQLFILPIASFLASKKEWEFH